MKVKPVGKKLQLELEETKFGALDVQQGAQIQEIGTISSVGPLVSKMRDLATGELFSYKVGDKILFKAWAVDILTVDGKKFYCIDCDSDALCFKVQ